MIPPVAPSASNLKSLSKANSFILHSEIDGRVKKFMEALKKTANCLGVTELWSSKLSQSRDL